jgi:Tol biopolymer transport system component
MKTVKDFAWLPDGRLIYAVSENPAAGDSCNYWGMRLDARSGQPLEKPMRLTTWAGFCMEDINMTADGKHLTFRKGSTYASTYVANLKPGGTSFLTERHFTLTTSFVIPDDWTADSKAMILGSNRAGNWGIYKQALTEDEPSPLVTGPEGLQNFHVSPDGKWVIYEQAVNPGDASTPLNTMRVPIDGGAPQFVFTAKPRSSILCARTPSKLCLIEEPTEDSKHVVFTAFDPLEGRGAELARFDVGSSFGDWHRALSPDGTRIAIKSGSGELISIFSFLDGSTQLIKVRGWNNLKDLNWAADAKSLFVLTGVHPKLAILNVDLHGNTHLVRNNVWPSNLPASPDGRHLAFMSQTEEGNMWMMENF